MFTKKTFIIAIFIFMMILIKLNASELNKPKIEEVSSKITDVIVYPEWAFVTRIFEANLNNGVTKYVLKGLPAWIDGESIQVKISPSDGVIITEAQTKTVFLQKVTEKEVLKIQEKVSALNDAIEDINLKIGSLNEQEVYLKGLAKWSKEKIQFDKVSQKIDTKEIESMSIFLQDSLLTNYTERQALYRKIRDLKPELRVWKKKLKDISSKTKLEQKEITIGLHSTISKIVKVSVSYLISGASWYCRYDARMSDENNIVNITCNAVVQQSTGEDWNDANFTLSTIKPYLIKEKPELNPWYVTPTSINQMGANLQRGYNDKQINKMKTIQQKQSDFMKSNQELEDSFNNYQSNKIKAEEVLIQAEERGTTVEFEIAGKFTVKTDGNPVRMKIGSADLTSEKQYTAIPVVSKSTYVSGTMRNEASFPLLPGEVKIYKNGNFIGKSKLDFVAVKEKMDMYLGLEERIKISRKLNAKKSSHALLRNKKILNLQYDIVVQNFLNKDVSITISDQLPVSQDNSVKIKITGIEPSIDPTNQGILKWEIKLKPMETKTITFGFTMEYPDNVYLDNANELEKQLQNL